MLLAAEYFSFIDIQDFIIINKIPNNLNNIVVIQRFLQRWLNKALCVLRTYIRLSRS